MADFISGVIGQLGRPMVKADQFNGIADALGRGIESVGKRQQLEGQKNEAENKKRGLLALSSVLKSANNPEQAKKILNQALSNGYLDEDDIEGMMMPDGTELNFQLIGDVLKMEKPELLDGYGAKDATASKTVYYKDGTSVSIMNDGSRIVKNARGELLQGVDAEQQIQLARESGLDYERDRSAAQTEGSERAKLKYLPLIKKAVRKQDLAASDEDQLALKKANLPAVRDMVQDLKELAPFATSTTFGKGIDFVAKEIGFGATKGKTAKTKYQSIILNETLPLLKATFGSAFTSSEGQKLEATLGDVDASPVEKVAALDAFLTSQERQIQTLQRKISNSRSKPSSPEVDAEYEALKLELL
jgi:hypothetical protein